MTDVVGIGEEMVLLVPEGAPLELASTLSMRVAGAEGNVLIGLSRLGHRTALLSAVGVDPFGTAVLRMLREEGVDTSAVVRDPRARTGVFFKDPTPSAERRVFYYRDGSAASRLGRDALAALDRLAPRVLVVSGLTLGLGGPEGLAGLAAEAIRLCHARGITTVFDANLRPGLWEGDAARADFEALRGHLAVLLAGREELAHLVPGRSGEDVAAELCRQGCAGVVVKDGPRGAVAVNGGGAVHVPAVDVDTVVDPVGAGDAFAAGVVSGWLRGWPLERGARLGALLAARVITADSDWEALPSGREADRVVQEAR